MPSVRSRSIAAATLTTLLVGQGAQAQEAPPPAPAAAPAPAEAAPAPAEVPVEAAPAPVPRAAPESSDDTTNVTAGTGETIDIEQRVPWYAAPPAKHPGSFQVVTREEIQRTNAANAGEVLARVPGVNYADEDGRGFKPDIGIRGLNPIRSRNTLILVNGVPMQPSMYGDPSSYFNVPVERLERIDVITGGPALLYGANTVGGVVNYITRPLPERDLEAGVRASYGSDAAFTGDAMLGGRLGDLRFAGFYLRKQGDGFRDNLGYDVDDVGLNVDGKIGARSAIAFGLNYHGEAEGTAGGLSPAQFAADFRQTSTPNDHFEGTRLSGDLVLRHDIGARGQLRLTAYANSFERNWYLAGTATDKNNQYLRQFDVFGLEPQYRLGFAVPHLGDAALTVGARLHIDQMTDRSVEGASPTARTGTLKGNNDLGTVAVAAYAIQELALTDRLTITPGLRLESIDMSLTNYMAGVRASSRTSALIPAIGASYRLPGETYAFAGFQSSFKPPEFKESIDPTMGVDRDLKAQRARQYELGVRSAPSEWLTGAVTAFYIDFDDQIFTDMNVVTNALDTTHRGVEASASLGVSRLLTAPLDLPAPARLGELSVHYALTLLDTEFENGKYAGNQLPYAPRHHHTFSLRYARVSGVSASLDGRLAGRQFSDGDNTRVTSADGVKGIIPSYGVWDANASYRWAGRASVFASAKNLLDARYFTFRGSLAGSPGIFPSPGRTLLLGVSYEY